MNPTQERPEPNPKNHHSVPRHALRRFCDPQGILWTYDKQAKKIYPGTPESQGCGKHFYSFQTKDGLDNKTIELKFMDKIDGPGSDAIETLLRHDKMTDEQAIAFMRFAAAQMIRVPSHFQRLEAMMSPIFQEMLERMAEYDEQFKSGVARDLREVTSDKVEIAEFLESAGRGEVRVKANRGYIVTIFLQTLDTITREFCQMGWGFLDTDNESNQFVISDNPLVLEDVGPRPARPLGIKNPNIEITMPLSARMVAIASWDGKCSFGSLPPGSVTAVNQRTIDEAARFVYAPYKSDELLERVVESQGRQAQTVVRRFEKDGKLLMMPIYARP
jgi:hypothetical protein